MSFAYEYMDFLSSVEAQSVTPSFSPDAKYDHKFDVVTRDHQCIAIAVNMSVPHSSMLAASPREFQVDQKRSATIGGYNS